MLTLDIKGAFDAVLPGRLIRRLRCQGWPENLVQRRVRIRLDGEIGDVFDLKCGLPQGSPVFPILFILYIEPLFKLGTGVLEGITFDTDKSELIYFTKRLKDKNPLITVRLLDGRQHIVQALKVYFNQRLIFKNYGTPSRVRRHTCFTTLSPPIYYLSSTIHQRYSGLAGTGPRIDILPRTELTVYSVNLTPRRPRLFKLYFLCIKRRLYRSYSVKLPCPRQRIHRLNERHPLRTRLRDRPGPDSRLRRMERLADWHTALSMVGYKPRKSKEELAIAFTDRLGKFLKRDIVVYTNGS
ncbi:transposon i [Colletotrichum incanum]|uniref:Transposon i n=1 Tax=Colletotrichum incanum TaxID=1573173 RepID=A0A162NRS8_COLIC|nr:transposon i [Colletotrichum incanum]